MAPSINGTQHKVSSDNFMLSVTFYFIDMISIIIHGVVKLSVIYPSVVAPCSSWSCKYWSYDFEWMS